VAGELLHVPLHLQISGTAQRLASGCPG
jgi:hypothetical protein